ncbi:unnamed protein product, partial [Didymodactylos carnosus]
MGAEESTIPERLNSSQIQALASKTKYSKDEIEKYYHKFITEYPSGKISKEAFYEAYHELHPEAKSHQDAAMFKKFDINNSGDIDFREFMVALKANSATLKLLINKDDI